MQRIMIIDFEIIERGGINRIVEGLQGALKSLGHVADYFWASKRGSVRALSPTASTMVGGRYFRLPARQLAYGSVTAKSDYVRLLKDYDTVLFMLPCPHDTKGNNGDMSWTMLYEVAQQEGKVIMTVMHDNLWDKYYTWYRQVSDMVDYHLFTCFQAKYDSLSRLPGRFQFLPTPLDVKSGELNFREKQGKICWMPQWKKWKGIYPFIDSLPMINHPVDLYNTGIEYHNFMAKDSERWINAIGLNHVRKTKGKGKLDHQYWGAQLPEEIPGIYKRHDISVDLSGSIGKPFDGQTSCVMLEAMLYGCVTFGHESIVNNHYSPFHNFPDIVATIDSHDPRVIADGINDLMGDKRRRIKIASAAFDFVRTYSDAEISAQRIIELIETGKQEPLDRPIFEDSINTAMPPEWDASIYERHEYISPNKYVPTAAVEEEDEIQEEFGKEFFDSVRIATISDDSRVLDTETKENEGSTLFDGRMLEFIRRVSKAFLDVYGMPKQ